MNEDEWQEYQAARAEAFAAWEELTEEEKAEAELLLKKLWELIEQDFSEEEDFLFEVACELAAEELADQ
jgi:hemerythrin